MTTCNYFYFQYTFFNKYLIIVYYDIFLYDNIYEDLLIKIYLQ